MREESDSNFNAQLERFRSGEFVPDTSIQIEVKNFPETDSVLKYPANMVEFYADSVLLERIWTTQAVNPYAEIDKQKLTRLFLFLIHLPGSRHTVLMKITKRLHPNNMC